MVNSVPMGVNFVPTGWTPSPWNSLPVNSQLIPWGKFPINSMIVAQDGAWARQGWGGTKGRLPRLLGLFPKSQPWGTPSSHPSSSAVHLLHSWSTAGSASPLPLWFRGCPNREGGNSQLKADFGGFKSLRNVGPAAPPVSGTAEGEMLLTDYLELHWTKFCFFFGQKKILNSAANSVS